MDKKNPLVSIVLATYNPDMSWLKSQLDSLNIQTYSNLELIILDDCSKAVSFEQIQKLTKESITRFPYSMYGNENNLGSNKTFEKLTELANGQYIAYCDQDDIWESTKIKLLIGCMEKNEEISLIYSDLSIIDGEGKQTASSLRNIRKRLEFKSGYNLTEGLLTKNFIVGCTMIVKSEIAKKAIPFEKTMVHDQWIAIIASMDGKIEYEDLPLINYRQHNYNQTGIMTGISDKKTYYKERIEYYSKRYESLYKRLEQTDLKLYIKDCIEWMESRREYYKKPNINSLKTIIKYRNIHKVSVMVEIFLPFIPNILFKNTIKLTKKGKI